MKLRDLDARLIRLDPSDTLGIRFARVETVAEAHGVDFECPLGHGHHVRVYFKSCPEASLKPTPRWDAAGSTIDDLTISPSIHVNPNAPAPKPGEPDVCRWHGFVRNGDAA